MSVNERLAKLEVTVEDLKQTVVDHMEKEEEDREELKSDLQELKEARLKDKAFLGGVAFAFSTIGAILGLAASLFLGR